MVSTNNARLTVLLGALTTVTAIPTASPTISPTSSLAPSTNPSVSQHPTISANPSSTPTVSQLPTPTPSSFPTPDCYETTAALRAAIARSDGLTEITYPLCPNTVFDLNSPDEPTLAFKDRTHIQCGFNGDVSDNCIVRGGDLHQIEFAGGSFGLQISIFGAKLSGITFEDAPLASLTAAMRGTLLIEDCVFQNHTRGVPVYGAYEKPQPPVIDLPFFDGIADDQFRMDVTFRRVLFKGNKQPPVPPPNAPFGFLFSTGVATAATGIEPRNNFVFEDCIFEDNEYRGVEDDVAFNEGFAVQVNSEGSSVAMRNSCFLNNRFKGDGLVLAFDGAGTVDAAGATNFVDETSDEDVFCDFIGTSDVFPDSVTQLTCINIQSTSCLASIFEDPGSGDDDDDDNSGDDDDDGTSSAIRSSWSFASCILLLLQLLMI